MAHWLFKSEPSAWSFTQQIEAGAKGTNWNGVRNHAAKLNLMAMKVGERVVDAIRTKTFYAFVSAVPADVIRARHRRIEEALNSKWVTHY